MTLTREQLKSGKAYELVRRPGKFSLMTAIFGDEDRFATHEGAARQFTVRDSETGEQGRFMIRLDGIQRNRGSKTALCTLDGMIVDGAWHKVTVYCSLINNSGRMVLS